jgi:hypothetical protein
MESKKEVIIPEQDQDKKYEYAIASLNNESWKLKHPRLAKILFGLKSDLTVLKHIFKTTK